MWARFMQREQRWREKNPEKEELKDVCIGEHKGTAW